MNNTPPDFNSTDVLYTLVLRPLKSDIPPIIRLRRALKALLRSYDLRCVDYGITQTPTHPRDLADESAFHQTIAFVLEEHGIGYEPLSIPTARLLWINGKASQ